MALSCVPTLWPAVGAARLLLASACLPAVPACAGVWTDALPPPPDSQLCSGLGGRSHTALPRRSRCAECGRACVCVVAVLSSWELWLPHPLPWNAKPMVPQRGRALPHLPVLPACLCLHLHSAKVIPPAVGPGQPCVAPPWSSAGAPPPPARSPAPRSGQTWLHPSRPARAERRSCQSGSGRGWGGGAVGSARPERGPATRPLLPPPWTLHLCSCAVLTLACRSASQDDLCRGGPRGDASQATVPAHHRRLCHASEHHAFGWTANAAGTALGAGADGKVGATTSAVALSRPCGRSLRGGGSLLRSLLPLARVWVQRSTPRMGGTWRAASTVAVAAPEESPSLALPPPRPATGAAHRPVSRGGGFCQLLAQREGLGAPWGSDAPRPACRAPPAAATLQRSPCAPGQPGQPPPDVLAVPSPAGPDPAADAAPTPAAALPAAGAADLPAQLQRQVSSRAGRGRAAGGGVSLGPSVGTCPSSSCSSGPAPSPSSFLPSPSPQPSQSPASARTPQNFSVPSPGPLNTPGESPGLAAGLAWGRGRGLGCVAAVQQLAVLPFLWPSALPPVGREPSGVSKPHFGGGRQPFSLQRRAGIPAGPGPALASGVLGRILPSCSPLPCPAAPTGFF